MTEPEVSLRLALYYIKNKLTAHDVKVSIDGAHIRTGNVLHFDITAFLERNSCLKVSGEPGCWQGMYHIENRIPKISLDSVPGYGDVQIALNDGVA